MVDSESIRWTTIYRYRIEAHFWLDVQVDEKSISDSMYRSIESPPISVRSRCSNKVGVWKYSHYQASYRKAEIQTINKYFHMSLVLSHFLDYKFIVNSTMISSTKRQSTPFVMWPFSGICLDHLVSSSKINTALLVPSLKSLDKITYPSCLESKCTFDVVLLPPFFWQFERVHENIFPWWGHVEDLSGRGESCDQADILSHLCPPVPDTKVPSRSTTLQSQ